MIEVFDVLKYVPNYDKIVSHIYDKKDTLTKRIIDEYRDYVWSIKEDKIDNVVKLDEAINEYIDNVKLVKFLKEKMDIYSINLVDDLLYWYNEYEKEKLKKITNYNWL